VQASAEAQAEGIVREEMRKRKRDEQTLTAWRKEGAAKVAIAQRLRRETTVTLAWIAERLGRGRRGT